MLSRATHVGIDQQGAPTELRQGNGQVGSEESFTVAGIGTDDGQGAARQTLVVEHPLHDLAADGPERFRLRRERIIQSDELGAQLALVLRCIGVVVLLRQGEQHVVGGGQAQLNGCLTETPP